MPYQVSMMGWVGSGEDFCELGWVQKFWVGLGFEKVTHAQLWNSRLGQGDEHVASHSFGVWHTCLPYPVCVIVQTVNIT